MEISKIKDFLELFSYADDDKMKWILIIIGCVVALGGMVTMLVFSKKQ